MYLLDRGADVRIQAKNGCTAFDMASLIGMLVPILYTIAATFDVSV
jgi:hypothetical protein